MKRCANPNCDFAFLYGDDKMVCPFCHSELVSNMENAVQFIQEHLGTMECHGRIVEIDHQELFNSKRLKLINTIFRGEPYQFAH